MKIAEVIIDRSQRQIDRPFDYLIGEDKKGLAQLGSKVLVPFGNSWQEGFILSIKVESEIEKLKEIKAVLSEPMLTLEQLTLISWLRQNYFCFYNTALKTILPKEIADFKIRKENRIYLVNDSPDLDLGRAPSQKKVLIYLQKLGKSISLSKLCAHLNVSTSPVKALEEKGILAIRSEEIVIDSDPLKYFKNANKGQEIIAPSINQQDNLKLLLDSLTSGGKFLWRQEIGEDLFSVYIKLIETALGQGKTILLLIPEVQLLKKIVPRFFNVFSDQLAIYHSSLTGAEKHHQWFKVKEGQAKVILGTRSSVFLPFQKLDLAILHGEDDAAFCPLDNPKYKIKEVLEKRLAEKGLLLLIALAPSITSYYETKVNNYQLLESEPLNLQKKMPEIIDMRQEFNQGNISMFSLSLQEKLENVLARKKRTLLFINRRGYAPFLLCRQCGFTLRCPQCQSTLTLHKKRKLLSCHYCSYQQEADTYCPSCASKFLRPFGVGTERVAEEVRKFHPTSKLLIFDSDWLKNRYELEARVKQLTQGKSDLVVGTQLALKEYMPPFDLVAVISMDVVLNLPHYAAREEAYSTLSYLKHMAWKGGGDFLIQTYTPENLAIKALAHNSYKDYAEDELNYRREFKHPPFYELLVLNLSGKKERETMNEIINLSRKLKEIAAEGEQFEILGPGKANIYYHKGYYRWQLACRSTNWLKLNSLAESLQETINEIDAKGFLVSLDRNPKKML